MYCVGLTGGIACGKSTISTLFQTKGVDVISADTIAKTLVAPHQPAFKKIIEYFGVTARTEQGDLNRSYLRDLIANDADKRVWLENLLHPLIRKQIEQAIQQCISFYCIIEIPLLTDKSAYPYLNRIVLVESNLETQLNRLMLRDNLSKQQALALLAISQVHDKQRQALADDYLMNNGSMNALQQQVNQLHDYFLHNAKDPL